MSKVLAAIMVAPDRRIELRELSEPNLEPNSALLHIELSEVCGTDLHLHRGRLSGVPYPIIPGHVAIGRLEKIHGRVHDLDGTRFKEGDRVTFLDVHRTCNNCWNCLVGKATTRCPSRRVYGITYGLTDGLTGGWAEKMYLKPQTGLIRATGLEPEKFMAGGCSLPTALHAVERARIAIGDTVLVLGSGPVGLSVIILAVLSGALQVLCIGGPPHRLNAARSVGAAGALDFESHSEKECANWVLQHTSGRGADITIEATGAPIAAVHAMRYTRDAGRAVIVGQYADSGETAFSPHHDLNKKHIEVLGCWGSDFSHFYRGVQLMMSGTHSTAWSHLSVSSYGLSQVNEALQHVAEGKVIKALIDPALH